MLLATLDDFSFKLDLNLGKWICVLRIIWKIDLTYSLIVVWFDFFRLTDKIYVNVLCKRNCGITGFVWTFFTV